MTLRIRGLLGIVIAVSAAILFLKYADTQNPLAAPSHLYQANNHDLPTGLPWWVLTGVIVGAITGLSLWRYARQLQQGFINSTVAMILVAVILSYFAFDGYTITLPSYLLVSAINIIVLCIVTALPMLAGLVVVTMITSRPAKRSAWDIMPDELKTELQHKAPQPHRIFLLDWLLHHGREESQ